MRIKGIGVGHEQRTGNISNNIILLSKETINNEAPNFEINKYEPSHCESVCNFRSIIHKQPSLYHEPLSCHEPSPHRKPFPYRKQLSHNYSIHRPLHVQSHIKKYTKKLKKFDINTHYYVYNDNG